MSITPQGYRTLTGQGSHPLSGSNGTVLEHRKVLYDSLGEGPHPCHWCGRVCHWGGRDGINVDHLDGDKLNNELSNLVPSCWGCNRTGVRLGADRSVNGSVLKTHCPQGHKLSGSNLESWGLKNGRRRCLSCHRAHTLARKGKNFLVEADRIYQRLMLKDETV